MFLKEETDFENNSGKKSKNQFFYSEDMNL